MMRWLCVPFPKDLMLPIWFVWACGLIAGAGICYAVMR
jgi:hypothetical protein